MAPVSIIVAYSEQAERYALGERVEVPLFAAIGGLLTLGLMVWYIQKIKRDKRRRGERRDRNQ